MLRSARRQRLHWVVLGVAATVLVVVVLAGLTRERVPSESHGEHEHAQLLNGRR